jgi:hypothetical protein
VALQRCSNSYPSPSFNNRELSHISPKGSY